MKVAHHNDTILRDEKLVTRFGAFAEPLGPFLTSRQARAKRYDLRGSYGGKVCGFTVFLGFPPCERLKFNFETAFRFDGSIIANKKREGEESAQRENEIFYALKREKTQIIRMKLNIQ